MSQAHAGIEWVIDASGCRPDALADLPVLASLVRAIIEAARLSPIAEPIFHRFPGGGVTALVALAESHLTCHTFPEHASLCLNVFCCRPRPDWGAAAIVERAVGASHVSVRRLERVYGPAAVAPTGVPSEGAAR